MATDIKQEIEERLKAQQEGKEYKDIGRVANTKKERAAYRLISSKMLTDLEQDEVMAYNMVKKENVWPAYNVQELKDKGNSSGCAFMKVKIRESVPGRPANSASKRSAYVHFLELLVSDLDKCYTYEDVRNLMDQYYKFPIEKIVEYLIDPSIFSNSEEKKEEIIDKIKTSPAFRSLQYQGAIVKLISEVFSKTMSNLMFNRSDAAALAWQMSREFAAVTEEQAKKLIQDQKERLERVISDLEQKIELNQNRATKELREQMSSNWRLSTYSKQIYNQDPEKFRQFVDEYHKRELEGRKRLSADQIAKYVVRPEDWSWFEKKPDEGSKEVKVKEKAINTKEPLQHIKRTGGLKIPSIKVQDIIDMFGFSAVNYGKYVDDTWSKNHTKHFLGAISDLAEILNFDIKQVNQIGKLSIAFGAKGHPGHMATYFPQTKDINLTRGNGDGSLAHEWGHYLDNVLSDLDVKKGTPTYGTEGNAANSIIAEIFKKIMQFIFKGNSDYTPRIPMMFYAKKIQEPPTFYSSKTGRQTVQILDDIDSTINQYLELAVVNQVYYTTQLNVFGYIINKFGLESYEVPMKLTTSYQWHKSAYNKFIYCGFDEDGRPAIITKVRSKYWIKNVELFARCFETVVLKKLLDKNRVSNYLVADINMEDIIAETWFEPYPQGKELEYLESLIDELFDTMKTIYSVGDYVPVSNVREDEYLDLSTKTDEGKTESGMVVDKSATEKTTTFIEENQVVEKIKKPRTRKQKEVTPTATEAVVETIEEISTPPENLSTSVEEISTPVTESIQETETQIPEKPEVMSDNIQVKTITPVANKWNEVPVIWRNVKAVRPIVFSLNPYDKKLNSLIKDFVGSDDLRPVMTSINFGENGVVCTDAHKLIHFPYDKKDFSGNYASPTSVKAFRLEKEKITTIDQATKKLNELKYPNWQAVVPKDNPYTYEIDTMKFYQYVSAAMNYANKSTKQIAFKYDENKAIGFNGEFLLQVLEAMMKIQSCPKIYLHMSEPSRAAIFSFEKTYSPISSTFVLVMPVMLHRDYLGNQMEIKQTYGASDIDFDKSLGCYFDFSSNEIHNADGSVADYQENYGDAPGLPMSYIAMFNSFLKSSELAKNSFVFSLVRISSDGIVVTDEKSRIEIPNDYDLEKGLYEIDNNVLVKNLKYDLDDYSLEKRVATKDPVFVAKKDAFIFYINKLSNHLGKDELRPTMQGVLLEKTSDVTHAVATDAHTIIHLNISASLSFSKPTFNFLILNIKQLLNVSKSMEANDVALYIDPELERYRIVSGRLHFEGELITKGMVNWKGVIPNLVKQKLEFNIKNLFECISNPDLKKYADSEYTKPKDLIVFNSFDEIYAIHNPKSNEKSVKLCDMKIKHSDINEMFNINQSFVGIMPNNFTSGNYINFTLGKLEDVIDSIGKEDCQVYYNELNQVYLFESENLNYKTSDVYKPEKVKKSEKVVTKPIQASNEKQEILDALTGAKTLLKYMKGKEKTNLLAYIRGLEILMK
jgi:hypothetical protein